MIRSCWYPLLLFCLLLSPPLCRGEEAPLALSTLPSLVRLTYDDLHLPRDERMSLVGASYLLQPSPWLESGIGVYGAVGGQRGGFFTGGIETTLRQRVAGPLVAQGGLFFGGGGGGSAPQGGGLMLRPHAGLLWETPQANFGAGIDTVWFPNGEIDSTQFTVFCEIPLEIHARPGWAPAGSTVFTSDRISPRRYFVNGKVYVPSRAVRDTKGRLRRDSVGVMGGGISVFVREDVYLFISAAGAVSGPADGYAEVTAGPGYRWLLPGELEMSVEAGIGAAGGGKVDTGGGMRTEAAAGLMIPLGNGFSGGVRAGYFWAPDGGFHGTMLGARVAYSTDPSSRGRRPALWRLRSGMQHIVAETRIKEPGDDQRSLNLLGVKIDRMIGSSFFFSGQALSAIDGGAGGYAVGLLGPGWTTPLWSGSPFFFDVELLAGAAGGGGVSTRGGFVLQPMAGIGWMGSEAAGVCLSGGMAKATAGHLQAAVVDLSFLYRFTTGE